MRWRMKSNVLATFLMCIIIVAIQPVGMAAKVAPITLEKLTTHADLILLGTVQEVIRLDGIPYARLRLSRCLKGPCPEDVYFLAVATWICDITSATAGEHGLYFLKYPSETGAKSTRMHRGGPLTQLSHAGRGRMPIRKLEGRDYATIWVGDVILPRSLATISGPQREYDFIRSVLVEDLVALISELQ